MPNLNAALICAQLEKLEYFIDNKRSLAKDYDTALAYFVELKESGYTGIVTEYSAKNVETGERENI